MEVVCLAKDDMHELAKLDGVDMPKRLSDEGEWATHQSILSVSRL